MKIKSGTEELIAKYLLGDITEHEKKQLDNWIKTSPQHEEFFNRLRTSASFRKRYEHIHRLTHTRHGNISKRNITKYQSHQFS